MQAGFRSRSAALAAALLVLVPAIPLQAQLGGLRRMRDKISRDDVPPPVPVTATVEWLYEDTGAPSALGMDSVRAYSAHRGSATLRFEVEPSALPGGQLSKTVESSGGRYSIIVDGSRPGSGGKIISASGSASLDDTYTEYAKADCAGASGASTGSFQANPRRTVQSARGRFDSKNVSLIITFRGERPIGVSLSMLGATSLSSTTTSPCDRAESASVDMAMPTPIFNTDAPAGWTFATTQSGRRYTVTGRMSGQSQGEIVSGTTTTTRTLRLTWEAPPAPDAGAPPPVVARPATISSGLGSITYTMGGKEATWLLGAVIDQEAMPGMGVKVLTYTSDGGGVAEGKSMITITLMKRGSDYMLAGISVQRGPGGDSDYSFDDARPSNCTLRVTPQAGTALQGSGTCTAGFSGAVVSRFTFSSSR